MSDSIWPTPPPATTRFWPQVNKNGPVPEYRPDLGPCWTWTGNLSKGYGVFYVGRRPGRHDKSMHAHRWAYEDAHGPVPDGLELDHLCRVPACVKAIANGQGPAHLEAVTHRVNMLRGETVAAANAAKTHCPQGHPYEGDNVSVETSGSRRCLTCKREQMRRARGGGIWPGKVYLEHGRPVVVLVRWGLGGGPRNVLIEREDGSRVVRPFRGLRRAS